MNALLDLTLSLAKNWPRADAYLRIWHTLCAQRALRPLLHEHAVLGWLIHVYLGPKSPMDNTSAVTAGRAFVPLPQMGGEGNSSHFALVLEAIDMLTDEIWEGDEKKDAIESLPAVSRELWGCDAFAAELVRRHPVLVNVADGSIGVGDDADHPPPTAAVARTTCQCPKCQCPECQCPKGRCPKCQCSKRQCPKCHCPTFQCPKCLCPNVNVP